MDAMEKLSERLAALADLAALEMLGTWDQLVMMPGEGGPRRAQVLGTLAGVTHDLASDERIGEWLGELRGRHLDGVQADVVRLAERDWGRARRVPTELAQEMSRAHAEGQESWQAARERDDFAAFVPALERNVALARDYAGCLSAEGEGDGGLYEVLLGDYDFGLRTEDVERLFGELARALAPLVQEAAGAGSAEVVEVPVAAQRVAVGAVLARLGVDEGSWRVDVSTHPFTAEMARRDTRLTTRYEDGGVESLLSSLHEYGHALYERQIEPSLERTNLGSGTSMSIHESQSKLWENHVARNPAFAEVLAHELGRGGFAVAPERLHAALVRVQPSLIRVSADPLTYPLHIVLRFELERALIEGDLAVADLPAAWRDGMRRLLGLEVPSDALGCLQDIHWSGGSFGYFPSYALGCLIAAQLWETLQEQLGPQEQSLRRCEVGEIQGWLAQHVHRYGRRLDTKPLVAQACGSGLSVAPFLRYVAPFAGG